MKLARWGREWPAPAKLNLFLHVLGRREDGYHRLQTAFQFLDFGDSLVFEPRRDGSVRRPEGPDGVPEADDLAVRAAVLLKAAAGTGRGVAIKIRKRIPAGAGLGGGSSDAATTLVALNHLWKTGLARDELAALAGQLGADVPVFVRGRAAFADGIGDVLQPVDWPRPWYLVVNPGCQVATAEIFGAAELTRNTPETTIHGFLSDGGRNDFEPVVRDRFPEVGAVLDWLSSYGSARMTGTGGCCFLDFDSAVMARAVLEQLPQQWTGFVARGLNRSPLNDYRSV
jgi:4-diphosphocytidyl-2-C-methyl-D-erythritol kinase